MLFVAGVQLAALRRARRARRGVASRSSSSPRRRSASTVLKHYQKDRLTSFLHPSDDPGDAGYQQNQSRIAIGAGQKTGRGDAGDADHA